MISINGFAVFIKFNIFKFLATRNNINNLQTLNVNLFFQYEGRPDSYDVWPEVVPAIKYVYIPDPYKG